MYIKEKSSEDQDQYYPKLRSQEEEEEEPTMKSEKHPMKWKENKNNDSKISGKKKVSRGNYDQFCQLILIALLRYQLRIENCTYYLEVICDGVVRKKLHQ